VQSLLIGRHIGAVGSEAQTAFNLPVALPAAHATKTAGRCRGHDHRRLSVRCDQSFASTRSAAEGGGSETASHPGIND
jgi:hypothetical protein